VEFIVKRFDLNLSTRPFPAYRLLNAALFLVFAVLLVISVWQAYGFVRFSAMAREIRDSERNVRAEAESLGSHVAALASKLDRPEASAKLSEIGFLNGLIARKDLSWTRLFSDLEDMVPDSVHLVSLRPDIGESGSVTLHLDVIGRSIADVSRFIEALEQSPEFQNVIVSIEQKEPTAATDVNITLTANYFPKRETR
jgi:Fimbrial assembly protein (PilN)